MSTGSQIKQFVQGICLGMALPLIAILEAARRFMTFEKRAREGRAYQKRLKSIPDKIPDPPAARMTPRLPYTKDGRHAINSNLN